MHTIEKTIRIDMGHTVTNHNSKCQNIHGHSYQIEVSVEGELIKEKGASDEGMIIDFSDLKKAMMEKIDSRYDHGFVIWSEDKRAPFFAELKKEGQKVILVDFIPTAENLAKHWFDILDLELKKKKIKLQHVKVWETPTSTAIYERIR